MTRTELRDIGEFALIERIKPNYVPFSEQTLLGIGDDAAVMRRGEGKVMFLATDLLAEGVHFDLAYMPLPHLGFKAVSVNVSDIVAMNGTPEQITVSLALSNRFSVEAVEALYSGIHAACKHYHIDLVGGDTTASKSGLVISIAITGMADDSAVAYRSGAQAGEIVCVTGDLGAAFMGLQVLEREKQVYLANPEMQPDISEQAYLIQRQLRPEARLDVQRSLQDLGVQPTSMIDISDGLASEALHLCKQSKVGMMLFEEKLPIDKMTYDTAREFDLDPITIMMNGGEDYELLFTIKESDVEKLRNHPDITTIGYTTAPAEGARFTTKQNHIHPLTAQGWNHFQS
jgi:thiamine-monophosphate kinase